MPIRSLYRIINLGGSTKIIHKKKENGKGGGGKVAGKSSSHSKYRIVHVVRRKKRSRDEMVYRGGVLSM